MSLKRLSQLRLVKAFCGGFLVLMGVITALTSVGLATAPAAWAVPENTADTTQTTETQDTAEQGQSENTAETPAENPDEENASNDPEVILSDADVDNCQESLGAIGWLICPTTGKLSEAVDWLYGKLESFLQINPVVAKDGEPIYEIWKYCLTLTNVVFVIFVLIVIYSQITGLGISNYGIKKALPKLIVAAVLVNLSFLICSVAVDASNMIGAGIRGVFQGVEDAVTTTSSMTVHLQYGDVLAALIGGGTLAVGAAMFAFDAGMIWMLIPLVLGAVVSVLTGLITLALRQAVVVLLIMIAPLAIVSNILPNTEQWFRKWKSLFTQMLVFYPMFSLLYGASSLAGFALIMSAKDGFGLLLGVAVQTLPLFFSLKMMQMSGSVLGRTSAWLQGLAGRPVGAARGWADTQRQLSKQKHLASTRAYTPSLRLMQFMSNRRIADEADLSEHQATVKNRGLAYRANRHYRYDGSPTRRGERAYREQAENLQYQRQIARDQNQMNKGLGYLAAGTRQRARLDRLDAANVEASDMLNVERARGEKINYENAVGFHKRMEGAIQAHMDITQGFELATDENGNTVTQPRQDYKFHMNPSEIEKSAEMARYKAISQIMEGNQDDVQYAAAVAAQNYDTQYKIVGTKMQKYFELTAATKDVEYKLGELTKAPNALENIDMIIPGMRILNQRGDTDLVREQLENVLTHDVQLGTHASQSLANFLMFEVKDSDPFLRRFGKYLNLETAQVYNHNKRKNATVSLAEYITGEHEEVNPETGQTEMVPSKRAIVKLMEGTSLDGIERTAMSNLDDMLKHTYTDADGNLDVKAYLKKRDEVQTAIAPQFISANLKFLSGSEQIQSMTRFLTGYNADGSARWDEGGDLASDPELAQKYFRDHTLQYLKDQTPAQILGLRSDYYVGLKEHLADDYLNADTSDWSEEDQAKHREYVREAAEIQTRYGDLPPEEAQKKRKQDLANLRHKMAGEEFQRLLDSRGKLGQIYLSRRSGAANNAKDWVRDWLGLDDELAVRQKLAEMDKKSRDKHREEGRNTDTSDDGSTAEWGQFNDGDRAYFASRIQAIWDNWHSVDDMNVEAFYDETVEYIRNELDGVGDTILRKYAKYYQDHPYADAHDLKDVLIDLINDPDNY